MCQHTELMEILFYVTSEDLFHFICAVNYISPFRKLVPRRESVGRQTWSRINWSDEQIDRWWSERLDVVPFNLSCHAKLILTLEDRFINHHTHTHTHRRTQWAVNTVRNCQTTCLLIPLLGRRISQTVFLGPGYFRLLPNNLIGFTYAAKCDLKKAEIHAYILIAMLQNNQIDCHNVTKSIRKNSRAFIELLTFVCASREWSKSLI